MQAILPVLSAERIVGSENFPTMQSVCVGVCNCLTCVSLLSPPFSLTSPAFPHPQPQDIWELLQKWNRNLVGPGLAKKSSIAAEVASQEEGSASGDLVGDSAHRGSGLFLPELY